MSERKIQDPADIQFICKLHAEGTSTPTIQKLLDIKEPGKYKNLTYENVQCIVKDPDNQHKIEKFREEYNANPMHEAISNKRTRLSDYNKERMRIIRSIDAMCDDKGIIPKTGWSKYTTLVKRLLELELAAREEVEKRPDLMAMLERIGPLEEKTDEELIHYERHLTIQLRSFTRGKGVQEPFKPEIRGRQGTCPKTDGKPA